LHVGGFAVAGAIEHVSATDAWNPLTEPTVTVDVAEFPGVTADGLSGEAAMVKSGRFTVSITEVLCTNPLAVPVTAMV